MFDEILTVAALAKRQLQDDEAAKYEAALRLYYGPNFAADARYRAAICTGEPPDASA